jgi:DNA-damage-inducible protein D
MHRGSLIMSQNNSTSNSHTTDVFHFDESKPDFNALANENGFTFWYASTMMNLLGYQSLDTFRKVIQRAISACTSLNIEILDNFVQEKRQISGKSVSDYRLSRFACYLVAMNGDPKKLEVAKAQAYFAAIAEAFRRYVENADEVERILIRDEISDHEKSLSGIAKEAGVTKYGLFQNAGYLGMYNLHFNKLKKLKGVPENRSPLDFMGKEELAANLFRVTQTEAKMRNEEIKGQANAENAAFEVGKKVRKTMQEISGTTPENLPPSEDIRKVKSAIKSSQKDFAKIDKKST